ncbi:hypothetical protein Btru_052285 [Bulinus truncatus]|nr:hypothetical protein Btru_052285 [Bulinus truncatus]
MRKLYLQTETQGVPIKPKITSARSLQRATEKTPKKSNCPTSSDGMRPLTCRSSDKCLTDTMICNGQNDCPKHEDEDFTLCVVRRWKMGKYMMMKTSHCVWSEGGGVIYGPTSGVIYGPTSGVIYGPTSGVIYGPTSGVIYGPTSGVIYGPTSGVIYGPTSGVIYGPTSGVIYGLSLLSVE